MVRKVMVLCALVMAVCAFATTASAAFGGPGPTPDVQVSRLRTQK